ncbi:N66 matrix protein-like [Aplysia californica]|uniref:N66 matrix protein-like n=1 Tax=Aplysia californica TaxID=6500 RepID=A0ABM1W4C4_APLCA|nr:N66 matrix protein-like [Aplysia californica]
MEMSLLQGSKVNSNNNNHTNNNNDDDDEEDNTANDAGGESDDRKGDTGGGGRGGGNGRSGVGERSRTGFTRLRAEEDDDDDVKSAPPASVATGERKGRSVGGGGGGGSAVGLRLLPLPPGEESSRSLSDFGGNKNSEVPGSKEMIKNRAVDSSSCSSKVVKLCSDHDVTIFNPNQGPDSASQLSWQVDDNFSPGNGNDDEGGGGEGGDLDGDDNDNRPAVSPIEGLLDERIRVRLKKNAAGSTLQVKVYNFLERPTGWKCFIYHFTV